MIFTADHEDARRALQKFIAAEINIMRIAEGRNR